MTLVRGRYVYINVMYVYVNIITDVHCIFVYFKFISYKEELYELFHNMLLSRVIKLLPNKKVWQ